MFTLPELISHYYGPDGYNKLAKFWQGRDAKTMQTYFEAKFWQLKGFGALVYISIEDAIEFVNVANQFRAESLK